MEASVRLERMLEHGGQCQNRENVGAWRPVSE